MAKNKEKYEPARKKWATENRDKRLSYYKDKLAIHQEFLEPFKSKPCLDCNKLFPSYVMEFDHVRGKKKYTIGKMTNYLREKVLEEIEKCELVCCVCHRIRTKVRRKPIKTPHYICFKEILDPLYPPGTRGLGYQYTLTCQKDHIDVECKGYRDIESFKGSLDEFAAWIDSAPWILEEDESEDS